MVELVVGCWLSVGTVFQTAVPSLFIIPRLRPGLLSLCSVLASSQILLFSCFVCDFYNYELSIMN